MNRVVLVCAATALVSALFAAPSHAVEKCKLKIDKKTGVIRVDAIGVTGALRWGTAPGAATNAFFNAAGCQSGTTAKRCELANPATLESKILPKNCTIYVDDDGAECSVWIRGCSPGLRESAGFLWKDADGQTIGVADETGSYAVRSDGDTFFYLPVFGDGSGFAVTGQRYYESANCSGPALMLVDTGAVKTARPITPTGPALYGPATGGAETVYASVANSSLFYVDQSACEEPYPSSTHVPPYSCCVGNNGVNTLAPAVSVDLNGFVPPFSFVLQ